KYFGRAFSAADPHVRRAMLRTFGVLFQGGALWTSLSLRKNDALPLEEYTELSRREIEEIAALKLAQVGLSGFEDYYPAEISGGMKKRAGLARALALDPEIVFFDEPSAGLDPVAAGDFDMLIRTLQRTLGLTVFMVTHDLESLYTACDRIAVLGNGKIIAAGSI